MEDSFSAPPAEQRERVNRIPLKKFEELDPDTATSVAIFYKASPKSATRTIYYKFPKDAAKIFSDRMREDILANRAIVLDGGGGQRDEQAFKDILDWIKECVNEKKCVHFRTFDESTIKPLSRYAKAINAADYLGIPARDFSEGLTKRLFITTKKLPMMDWDEVEYFYTKLEDTPLRSVAAHSIFWAWWNKEGKLGGDDDTSGDDLARLDELRQQYPLLDEDLHERCTQNEADVAARREAKREERLKQASSGSGDGWGGDSGYAGSNANSGGQDGSGEDFSGGFNSGAGAQGWDKENTAPADAPVGDWEGADNTAGADWADEVNTQEQLSGQW